VVVGLVAGFSLPCQAEASGPVGKIFPRVSGSSLGGDKVILPDQLAGSPAVLLVAYRRGAQEDVDLWREFIESSFPELPWLEVPAISSPIWRPFAGWIDNGMRRGVPRPLWPNVVTLYRDARVVEEFLGRAPKPVTHVVVLDPSGRVTFFDAAGFSESTAAGLERALRGMLDGG
jgi:hypothetical protein